FAAGYEPCAPLIGRRSVRPGVSLNSIHRSTLGAPAGRGETGTGLSLSPHSPQVPFPNRHGRRGSCLQVGNHMVTVTIWLLSQGCAVSWSFAPFRIRRGGRFWACCVSARTRSVSLPATSRPAVPPFPST